MSRSISVTVTYKNGQTVTRGIYKPTNAEYIKSILSYNDLFHAFAKLKADVGAKKYLKIVLHHDVSTGLSKVYTPSMVVAINDLSRLDYAFAMKQVNINSSMYLGTLE